MTLNLEEIKIQLALGTLNESMYAELIMTDDVEVLKYLSTCEDVAIRRQVAANINTPFSIIQKLYRSDPDRLVRECAWEHVRQRYLRMYGIEPPRRPSTF